MRHDAAGAQSGADISVRSHAFLWLLTAAAALVFDWGSLALSRAPGQVASIWPGDAVVLVLMLAKDGRGAWGRYVAGAVGAFAAERLWGDALTVSLGLAASNFLGIGIVFIALRLHGTLDLQRVDHVLKFLAWSAVASMISAVSGAIALRILWGADFLAVWARWMLGDWLGYAVMTPPLLVLAAPRGRESPARISPRQAAAALLAYTALAMLVFIQTRYPLLFLTPLALFAVAYLLELDGVMIAILITVVVGTTASMAGRGPGALVNGSASERLIVLQFFLASMTVAFLPISAVMTQRRRLEEALREARAAAEAGSALKSEFLANVSHELRTPLASILGFAGILRNNTQLGADDRDHAENISVAGSALLTTANDILAFSELEAGKLEIQADAACPETIAAEAIKLFQAGAAAKGLSMTLQVEDGARAAVLVDRGRVRQVLLNLLANAVKFTDAGSVAVAIAYDESAEVLSMTVIDTGPGLDADQIPYLFDRFSRADAVKRRRHGGTGLGLAICKGLVEAMGGTIGASSALGEGMTVRFSIPAPTAPEPVPAPRIAP